MKRDKGDGLPERFGDWNAWMDRMKTIILPVEEDESGITQLRKAELAASAARIEALKKARAKALKRDEREDKDAIWRDDFGTSPEKKE